MILNTPHRFVFAIARGDAFGGSSLHVMDMASRLEEDGHRVRILIGGEPDMEVPRRYARRDLDVVCLPTLGRDIHPLRDARALWGIRSEVKKFRPHLVSLHASKAGALGRVACMGLGVPVVYTPHCWSFADGFPRAGFYRRLEKALAPLASRIITVSDDERSLGLKNGVGSEDRTVTIRNGVRDQFASPGHDENEEGSPMSLVMVGRFEKQKNQRLLIEVLAELQELPWQITFIGDGPLRAECASLAGELGMAKRMDFVGYRKGVGGLLGNFDAFVLTTHWEGLPRSILEAMAAGLPIVASDVGGSREAILDGVTGWLVNPDSAEELSHALREMIGNPGQARAMGEKGRERFLAHFTFDRMYQDYLRLYQKEIAETGEKALQTQLHQFPTRAAPSHSELAGRNGE